MLSSLPHRFVAPSAMMPRRGQIIASDHCLNTIHRIIRSWNWERNFFHDFRIYHLFLDNTITPGLLKKKVQSHFWFWNGDEAIRKMGKWVYGGICNMEEERVHVWFDARYTFKKEIWVQDLEKGSTLDRRDRM